MAGITVNPIPPGARRSKFASTNLLHEWISVAHPTAVVKYEMRLGPTVLSTPGFPLSPAVEAMLRNSNLYADAVVIEPTTIEVVEAKMIGFPGAVSQLRAYAMLVMGTPELRSHIGKQLIERHLWAVDNELARQMAQNQGQVVTIFTPQWVTTYLETRYRNQPSLAPDETSSN